MNETFKEAGVTLEFGIVTQVDEAKHRVKVRIPDLDDMETHWLPVQVGASFGNQDYGLPDEETQVALLLDSRGENGLVLGAVYSEADPPPVQSKDKWHKRFKDGTSLEYDRASHVLTVDVKGEVRIKATGEIKIEAQTASVQALVKAQVSAPLIDLDAPLTKTKNLLVQGLIQFG